MLQQAINRVTSEVVSVPTEIARDALYRAVKDFAYHTGVIEHSLTIILDREQTDYTLHLPEDMRLSLVEELYLNDRRQRSVDGFRPVRALAPRVAFRVKTYVPPVLWIVNIGPAVDGKEVELTCRLEPETLEAVPDNVWAKYGGTVHYGALAILYGIPSRPWSAPAYAAQHRQDYTALRARARQERARGGSQHDYPMHMPKITRR